MGGHVGENAEFVQTNANELNAMTRTRLWDTDRDVSCNRFDGISVVPSTDTGFRPPAGLLILGNFALRLRSPP